MDFDLSDQHELLRRTVREFAEGEVAPVAEELDRTHAVPYEIIAKLGALNLMGIPFPEEYGGGGGDTLAYTLTVEELTRVDSSVAITLCAHTSLGTQPVYLFGTEDQRREWMPRLCSGEILGAFGLTEAEAGSDAANMRTRARRDGDDWVIDGAKQFITNAGTDVSGVRHDHRAHGRQGDHELPRPQRHARLRAGRAVPQDGLARLRHAAADVLRLPRPRGEPPRDPAAAGSRSSCSVLEIGRIGVAAMGLGLAQGALDQALAYAKQRRAFGKAISKFQTIQAKLADMSTEIEAARLLVYRAALLKDAGRPFGLAAAQAKLMTGRLAVRCADEAVQIHGGYGYIEEYPVCRMYRDAKILTIGEGTDEIQQMVIARGLGA